MIKWLRPKKLKFKPSPKAIATMGLVVANGLCSSTVSFAQDINYSEKDIVLEKDHVSLGQDRFYFDKEDLVSVVGLRSKRFISAHTQYECQAETTLAKRLNEGTIVLVRLKRYRFADYFGQFCRFDESVRGYSNPIEFDYYQLDLRDGILESYHEVLNQKSSDGAGVPTSLILRPNLWEDKALAEL